MRIADVCSLAFVKVVGAKLRDLSMGMLVTPDGIATLQRVGSAFEDMLPIGDVDKAAAT